nr:hypothetical protein [Leptothrix ochracea]
MNHRTRSEGDARLRQNDPVQRGICSKGHHTSDLPEYVFGQRTSSHNHLCTTTCSRTTSQGNALGNLKDPDIIGRPCAT